MEKVEKIWRKGCYYYNSQDGDRCGCNDTCDGCPYGEYTQCVHYHSDCERNHDCSRCYLNKHIHKGNNYDSCRMDECGSCPYDGECGKK